MLSCGCQRRRNQHLNNCLLEGCADIIKMLADIPETFRLEVNRNGGFETREGELEAAGLELRPREPMEIRISLFRELIDLVSAGITQSEKFGNLVECLSRRIISGATEYLILAPVIDLDQQRVPS